MAPEQTPPTTCGVFRQVVPHLVRVHAHQQLALSQDGGVGGVRQEVLKQLPPLLHPWDGAGGGPGGRVGGLPEVAGRSDGDAASMATAEENGVDSTVVNEWV